MIRSIKEFWYFISPAVIYVTMICVPAFLIVCGIVYFFSPDPLLSKNNKQNCHIEYVCGKCNR